jgi:hypothetical protein
MGRKVRIESEDGILTIRTAPIFQRLLAPEHKGSRCTPANAAHSPPRRSPAPARARRSARRPSSLSAKLINHLLLRRTPVGHPRRNLRRRRPRSRYQITRWLPATHLPPPTHPPPHLILRASRRQLRPISAMIAARSNIFSTSKKSPSKIKQRGPRAQDPFPIAAPLRGRRQRAATVQNSVLPVQSTSMISMG